LHHPTLGVDALNGRYFRQYSIAATLRHLELKPGDVTGRRSRHARSRLALYAAAIEVIPIRPGVVASNGFPVDDKRRNGFSEFPAQRATLGLSGIAYS